MWAQPSIFLARNTHFWPILNEKFLQNAHIPIKYAPLFHKFFIQTQLKTGRFISAHIRAFLTLTQHNQRVMGIEPTQSAWKAEVLPLNYTREIFGGGRIRTFEGIAGRFTVCSI